MKDIKVLVKVGRLTYDFQPFNEEKLEFELVGCLPRVHNYRTGEDIERKSLRDALNDSEKENRCYVSFGGRELWFSPLTNRESVVIVKGMRDYVIVDSELLFKAYDKAYDEACAGSPNAA